MSEVTRYFYFSTHYDPKSGEAIFHVQFFLDVYSKVHVLHVCLLPGDRELLTAITFVAFLFEQLQLVMKAALR